MLKEHPLSSIKFVNRVKLFSSGLLQICLVTSNVYLISLGMMWAIFLMSCLIAFTWTWNIKKIAFGDFFDRISYSFGAGTGAILGLYLVKLLVK